MLPSFTLEKTLLTLTVFTLDILTDGDPVSLIS